MPTDSPEKLQSIQSLREILAKDARNTNASSPRDGQQHSSSTPVNISQAHSLPRSISSNIPDFKFPTVNVSGSSPQAAESSSRPLKIGHSFFKSFRGRSAFDADEDEFDSGRKYSTDTVKEQPEVPATPGLAPTQIQSPRLNSPYPLQATPTLGNRAPRDLSTLTSPPTTPTATRPARVSSISWADQFKSAEPAPSEPSSEAEALGSRDVGADTSSTLSLASTLDFAPPAPFTDSNTIRTPQNNLANTSLAAARDISPFKGNMWDPEDGEWAEVDDARKVVETFTASYRAPRAKSPIKSGGAMSYLKETVKSVLLSPSKKAAEEKLRQEERVQDQLEELRNSYYYDPAGDLHDDIMAQVFMRDPLGHFTAAHAPRAMHVMDLDAYFHARDPLLQESRPRLSDAVATILAHTSKECVAAFLDPRIEHFTYRREVDRSKGGLMLIVRRQGNTVICGAYVNFGFMLQWKLYVKSKVNILGEWHEVYATTKPGLMRIENGVPEWDVIRPSEPESKGEEVGGQSDAVRKLELSPRKKMAGGEGVLETNPKFMLFQSRFLARHLLWDIWFLFDRMYECRATWEADGEEVEVRMKRDMVGSGEDGE